MAAVPIFEVAYIADYGREKLDFGVYTYVFRPNNFKYGITFNESGFGH